ncbi:MAG TPA: hypothetical protein VGM74_01195 [Burkholderiaceae bacterium]
MLRASFRAEERCLLDFSSADLAQNALRELKMEAARWPDTPIPITAEWVKRCIAALISADRALWVEEANAIALEMSSQWLYRSMLPEAAVVQVFGPVKQFKAWD